MDINQLSKHLLEKVSGHELDIICALYRNYLASSKKEEYLSKLDKRYSSLLRQIEQAEEEYGKEYFNKFNSFFPSCSLNQSEIGNILPLIRIQRIITDPHYEMDNEILERLN